MIALSTIEVGLSGSASFFTVSHIPPVRMPTLFVRFLIEYYILSDVIIYILQ